MVRVLPYSHPAHLPQLRTLLGNYMASLAAMGIVGTESHGILQRELDRLPGRVLPPRGTFLLAHTAGEAVGCIAVVALPARPGAFELKRMWVEPASRSVGVGRALLSAAIGWAREHGAHELLLDTLPEKMPEALRLYTAMGFLPTDRYNSNRIRGVHFLRLALE